MTTYLALKTSGMKAGLFSIDDKWEGAYGNLEHSKTRLPGFEQFLEKLRSDGYRVGIWAALMRCERPSDIGLTEDNMLKTPNSTPLQAKNSGTTRYYIIDFTQPAVEKVLTDLVKKFVRRYKPDLFKFDFGYELPAAGIAAPQDKKWTGERLMWKGLDIVIKAMREENPDLVVMYYQLATLSCLLRPAQRRRSLSRRRRIRSRSQPANLLQQPAWTAGHSNVWIFRIRLGERTEYLV